MVEYPDVTFGLNDTPRTPMDIPDRGLLCDLLWADPVDPEQCCTGVSVATGFFHNDARNVSVCFDVKALTALLNHFQLQLVIRGKLHATGPSVFT